MATMTLRPITLSFEFRQRVLFGLLIVLLVYAPIVPIVPLFIRPNTLQVAETTNQSTAIDSSVDRQPFDLTALPSPAVGESRTTITSWNGYSEIVDRRDAHSRHYDLGDGKAVALVSKGPLNAMDALGKWQPLEPHFEREATGYVIRSGGLNAGVQPAGSTVLFEQNGTLTGWRPQALQLLDADGVPIETLARPKQESDSLAVLSTDERTLTTAGHWTDSTIQETFHGSPGSLEQSLILAAPPQQSEGVPKPTLTPWFALEAELYLLSGESLWVSGHKQTDHFTTEGLDQQTLEIRDQADTTLLSLAPVLAYEAGDSDEFVAGHYRGELVEPGVWRLLVVTPMDWWMDPIRSYPAVLDPEFYVQVTQPVALTRHYDVADDPAVPCGIHLDQDEPAEFVSINLGVIYCWVKESEDDEDPGLEIDASFNTATDIVFDPLPPLPEDATITGADLVLDGYILGDNMDFEVVNLGNDAVLDTLDFGVDNGLDDCFGSSCSLYDDPPESVEYTFDLPDGAIVPVIENWYAGSNHGLQVRPLMPLENNSCGPLFTVTDDFSLVYECGFRSTASPQLLIYYETTTLAVNQKIINQRIPGYNGEYFGRSGHEYSTTNLPQEWTGIAVLTDADANRQVYAPLEVQDKVSQKNGTNPPINRRVNFLMLDNSTGQLPNTTSGYVRTSQDNFSGNPIPDAVYDIMFAGPHQSALQNPTTDWTSQNRGFSHQDLLGIFPFDLASEHTLTVRVIAPDDDDIHVELFPPQPGLLDSQAGDEITGEWVAARGDSPHQAANSVPDGNGNRIYQIDAKSSSPFVQSWALAIAHDGANDVCPGPPPSVAAAATDASGCPGVDVTIEMLACPPGEYPTLRFGCQSLIYPHESVGGPIIINPTAVEDSGGGDAVDAAATNVPATAFYDVGSVRIFSEGGFVGDEGGETPDAGLYGDDYDVCTENEDRGMPLLGITSDSVPATSGQSPPQRLIPVRQGSVCVDGDRIHVVGTVIPASGGDEYGAIVAPSIRENSRRPVGLYDDEVELYHGRIDTGAQFGTLDAGEMVQDAGDAFHLVTSGLVTVNVNPWDGWDGMPQFGFPRYIEIDERSATGEQDGTIRVTTEPKSDAGSGVDVAVASTWRRRATLTPAGFELDIDAAIELPMLAVAAMELRFHSPGEVYVPPNSGKVAAIHLPDATVHQPTKLGGAYKPVQAVIRKTGLPIREKDVSQTDDDNNLPDCGATRSCVDVRRHDDIDSADWIVPDVVAGGETGMVMMQADGVLQVFSADHPDHGLGAAASNAEQSFNFKTFSGEGTTVIGECAGEENVTIVSGQAKVSLPMLGNGMDEPPSALDAYYKICAGKFREAHLSFNIFPPGIPAGASGLVLESLAGEVEVGENYVQIGLNVGFRTYDGATVTRGDGGILIDTRGLFRLSGQARLVGTFSAEGSLAVGWSPLDILLEAGITFQDWLAGGVRLHMWRGQGYGGQYHWLPDNNDLHFTGIIGATFTLKKGRIGTFWKITLPPADIKFGVEVSFGEFCSNDSCTSYKWGVQGKLTILSFTVGAFVGEGPDVRFFLGDKGVKLIDQAFETQAAALHAIPTAPISDLADGDPLESFDGAGEGLCPVENTVATCSFTVEADTGEMMVGASWADGTLPTVMLHTPDGVAISANGLPATLTPEFGSGVAVYVFQPNSESIVRFALDPTSAFYTVESPQPGEWTLTFADLTGDENYNVIFAANAPAPEIILTTPDNGVFNGTLDIQWDSAPAGSDATIHLSYITESEYISFTTGLDAGAPITEVAGYRGGVVIAPNVPIGDGSYQWTTGPAASGAYYVVARVDHPIHGSSFVLSPGPFTYTDTTPPAVPSNLQLTSPFDFVDSGIIASWTRNTEGDLSAYEVVYDSPDGGGGFIQRTLRVPPSDPLLTNPNRERVRLVGLVEGIETTVCVRAVDASGNSSDCSPPVTGTPFATNSLEIWIPPAMTSLQNQPGPELVVQWDPGGGSDGFLLSWAHGCASTFTGPPADQGTSNLDVGNVSSFGLTGLPPGTYRVAVRGYKVADDPVKDPPIERIGAFSNIIFGLLSGGADDNGDGLPDDWAEYFGVSGAGEDPDDDGLTNDFERLNFTDPTNRDSDGDGFEDGPETFAWLTNPCDPAHYPASVQILDVSPADASLRFEAVVGENPADTQTIEIRAFGRGLLPWTAVAGAGWIDVSPTSGDDLVWFGGKDVVRVSVDATNLDPGYYESTVRILANTGGPVHQSPYDVPVRLWVLRNRVDVKTRVGGYVFLDENRNGVEDGSETIRVGGVTVDMLNAMGGVMNSVQSAPNTGRFDFAQLPYATYGLRAFHVDYEVTTTNPQPLELTPETDPINGLRIGVARREIGPQTDNDRDGVLDIDEDRNGNGNLNDDDTDKDTIPDYLDSDDDGDGIKTQTEGTSDVNADGVPDYLDKNVIGTGSSSGNARTIFLPLVNR